MQQRQALEQQRDQLNRDISAKDADILRNQQELAQVKGRIAAAGKELKELEANLLALRRGDVVISSGQSLVIAKVQLQKPSQRKEVIEALLQQANKVAFQRVLPGQSPERQVLLVPRGDITKLEDVITKPGTWVVSIVSAGNVLRGERRVVAFPDVRPNRQVVRLGEQMATTVLEADERSPQEVQSRLNLLLAATFTRAQRQGALADGLQFDISSFNRLGKQLSERPSGQTVRLESVSQRDSDIADPLVVELRWLQTPGNGQAGRSQP